MAALSLEIKQPVKVSREQRGLFCWLVEKYQLPFLPSVLAHDKSLGATLHGCTGWDVHLGVQSISHSRHCQALLQIQHITDCYVPATRLNWPFRLLCRGGSPELLEQFAIRAARHLLHTLLTQWKSPDYIVLQHNQAVIIRSDATLLCFLKAPPGCS